MESSLHRSHPKLDLPHKKYMNPYCNRSGHRNNNAPPVTAKITTRRSNCLTAKQWAFVKKKKKKQIEGEASRGSAVCVCCSGVGSGSRWLSVSELVKAAPKNPYQERGRGVKGRSMCKQTQPCNRKRKKKKQPSALARGLFFFSLFGTLIFSQGWKICLVNIKNIYIRGECWNGLQKSRPWNVTVVICDNLFLFHYVSVCGASLLWCLCTLLRGEHSSFKQGRTKTPFSLGFCAAEVYVALHGAPLFAFFSALVCECCSWVFAPVRLLLLLLLGVLERQI